MAPLLRMMTLLPPPSPNRIAYLTYKNTKTEHVQETFRVFKEILQKPETIHIKQGW